MSKYVKPEGTWIYFLSGPDGVVRYVGKAVETKGRYAEHLRNASLRSRRPSRLWIAKLLRDGHRPTMTLIEFCRGDGCGEEMHHVRLARADGLPLLNLTEGGEGASGYRHTPEARAKMSAQRKGRKLTEEHKRKIGAACKGQKRSEDFCRKISAAHRGKILSPEHRDRLSQANRGRKHDPEHIERRAAKLRGRKLSPEHIAKSAEGRRGFRHTEEAKARMSAKKKGVKFGPQSPELTERKRVARVLCGGDPLVREVRVRELFARQREIGLTLRELAQACDVHPAVIANWRRGHRLPILDTIEKAHELLEAGYCTSSNST